MRNTKSRYDRIIEKIFFDRYNKGDKEVPFARTDFAEACGQLKIELPKNVGDVIYSFRYRKDVPESMSSRAPTGYYWLIRPAGRSQYKFALVRHLQVTPNQQLVKLKIPDATPSIVSMYALSDEQALLAKIRYNRLIDIFTGVTCYSLQSHLRTSVKGIGQIETDEIYIGIDKHGIHYVMTIQAKAGNDRIGIVQLEQDMDLCAEKFPNAVGRQIAAQFLHEDTIALFEFILTDEGLRIFAEQHSRLVPAEKLSPEELRNYRNLAST